MNRNKRTILRIVEAPSPIPLSNMTTNYHILLWLPKTNKTTKKKTPQKPHSEILNLAEQRSISLRIYKFSGTAMAAVRPFLFLFLFLTFYPSPSISQSQSLPETDALLKLKQSFSTSQSLSSWLPNQNPCTSRWTGVICNKGVIISLHLSGLGLSGNIDVDSLMQIPTLRSISFVNNNFSGPIPHFNKLGTLKAIYLTGNQFTGPIPSDFFSHLASLKKIWISNNKFSGNIPGSVAQLRFLAELHLENNEFSGPLLEFSQELKSFDVSNNKLEGAIPTSMSRFEAKSFLGNEGLCGKPLDKECGDNSLMPQPSTSEEAKGSGRGMKLILFVVIVAILAMIFVIMKSRRGRDDDIKAMRRDRADEVVQVHVPGSNRSKGSDSGRKESKKGAASRGGIGDLVMVNDEKGVFGLPDLMKAAAEVLGNGGLGSAYKAAMSNGLSVVVKRMREMNKVSRDIFDAEMRRFGRLRNPNILTPLAFHYRREEKLFVTEYKPKGSLLYVLHGDRGSNHADLNWPIRLNIVKGIAQGMRFLYSEFSSEDLPHGNLKSSNVILADNYEPLLSDFAFHPLINPNYAVQTMFAYKTPDYVQYQHISQKTDVYCLGIIILEIMTGKFPSQYHSNGKGGTDVVQWVFTAISERREAELIDPDLKNNHSKSINQMLQLIQIGAACTESNPDQRLNMKEAIRRIEEVQV